MNTGLQNGIEGKMGKINDKMENITSGTVSLYWFQHDISIVIRNKDISCLTHKPIMVLFS